MTFLVAAIVSVAIGPLVLGIVGIARSGRHSAVASVPIARTRWDWRLSVSSGLLYVLAFNLTFLLQEIFLVLPKAAVPGLTPTLFHNNRTWTGDHPLVGLLQGSGALAILLIGLMALLSLRWSTKRSITTQLLLVWMAYHGLFQSLSQVVVGALNPGNDVGMAMTHLALSEGEKVVLAVVALALLVPVAFALARHCLALATPEGVVGTPGARARIVLQVVTVPALTGILLIIPFRMPRGWIEVALLPAIITWLGVSWMQAGAWRLQVAPASGRRQFSIAIPLGSLLALFVLFQTYLRAGVTFD